MLSHWFHTGGLETSLGPRRATGRTHTYLWASPCAVHDSVTTVERKGILQLGQALLGVVVSGVDHPAIGLKGSSTRHIEPFREVVSRVGEGTGSHCKGEPFLPASAPQGPGTCPRSTSNWDSWCCSTRRGCTRRARPAQGQETTVRPGQNSPAKHLDFHRGDLHEHTLPFPLPQQ